MRDLVHNVKTVTALKPVALSSTTNRVGVIIDTKGFHSIVFHVLAPDIQAATLDAKLAIDDGNESNLSDAGSGVPASNIIGSLADTTLGPTTDGDANLKVGVLLRKRYIRATLDVTANNGTDVIAVCAVLGHPQVAPEEA
jgi:hypothetical protein